MYLSVEGLLSSPFIHSANRSTVLGFSGTAQRLLRQVATPTNSDFKNQWKSS